MKSSEMKNKASLSLSPPEIKAQDESVFLSVHVIQKFARLPASILIFAPFCSSNFFRPPTEDQTWKLREPLILLSARPLAIRASLLGKSLFIIIIITQQQTGALVASYEWENRTRTSPGSGFLFFVSAFVCLFVCSSFNLVGSKEEAKTNVEADEL